MLWDDDGHLTRPDLRPLSGLWRIWFDIGATQQYYPVVHSAFWIMARLWGDHTLGYHLVNIVLHATSAALLVVILRKLDIPGAWLAGLIYAVHPVEVESVAWMTELKNTLSGVFYFLAALTYLRFDARRDRRAYELALLLFVLALLSKSVTATLPAALLIVFWWQRGRLVLRRDVLPLVPFLVAGALAGATTSWVERTYIGAVGSAFDLSIVVRALVAGRATLFYLRKVIWPSNLIFFYPRWNVHADAASQYLFPLAVLLLIAVLWRLRRISRAPLAAVLFFIVTLAPALGFVNVFPFKYSFVADHFQYLASAGIIALVAAAVMQLASRVAPARRLLVQGAIAAAICLPLFILTWRQSHYYVDAPTLYRATLDRNPQSWLAHNNLAMFYGDGPRALQEFQIALTLSPDEPIVHYNLGTIYAHMNRFDLAVAEERQALRAAPHYAEAWGNLGGALQKLGRTQEAVAAYREALRIKPGMAGVRANLGVALQDLGRSDEAAAEIGHALQEKPATAQDHAALGDALLQSKRLDQAIAEFQAAVHADPGSAIAGNSLGYALIQAGRWSEAEAQLRDTLRRHPENVAARDNLGNVLQRTGRIGEAIGQYRQALGAPGPNAAEIHNDLGVALATMGRRREAVAEFEAATRLKPGFVAAEANLRKARQ
jgi:tetratricopeptide (TPR) repeat protein